MQLKNETQFSPFIFEAYGQRDEILQVVFCRGTFDIRGDGTLSIASKQQPVVLADQYRTEAVASSVQVDTDLVPHKLNADITFNAIAHAPNALPRPNWPVDIQVGLASLSLNVTGPRHWEHSVLTGWRLTAPESIHAVPLHYEYAFGGKYLEGDEEVVFEQNPVGRGFVNPKYANRSQTIPAPQIEFRQEPIQQFGKVSRPAGAGPIAKYWLPRRNLCGTADDHWKENRWPLRPLDFDFNYYNSAPPGLVYSGFLNGDESVTLQGLHPTGIIRFQLPCIALVLFALDQKHAITFQTMRLDTLHIDTTIGQVFLTWRQSFPKTADLITIQIMEEPMTQAALQKCAEADYGR